MNKICDNYPDFCLPFSPNWYLPQIVSIDKTSHNMAFGVNNTVFIMNYSLKIPITTLICDKNLPIHSKKNESSESKPQNSKSLDDKITSILIYQQFVIAGFENSYLSIWIMDKNLNETRQIVLKQYQFLNQILFIVPLKLKEHEEKIICVDLQGISLIITFNEKEILNEELRKINLEKPEENIKIKLINFKKIFDEYFLFVFNSGKIQVWPQNFEILITEIDIKKKILYFDSILSHENNIETLKILCITKEHSKNTLYSTFLSKDDIEYNYKAKKNPSLKEELSKASQVLPNIQYEVKLDFHLTETYIHNKEDLKQASLCVKWLNSSECLVSGKMGEIYLLNKNIFQNKGKIKFSPLSSESDVKDNAYYTVPDNPHFKSIYEFFTVEPSKPNEPYLLITLGLDRKIVFWTFAKEEIQNSFKFDWKINCLGGKVKCLADSQKEKNLVIFGSSDHTIKLWNLEKKNNRFFTIEIWRKLGTYDINQIKVSSFDPEILYIKANENQLLIYNAYSQNMQYTFKSSLIIISFYEICSNVQEYFRMNFDKCDGFGEKIKTELKNFMGKKTNIIDKNKPNNLLLLFCKDFEATQSKMSSFYFILYNFTLENVEIFKVNIENITAISLKIFDNKENFQNLIIAFGTYEGSIHIAYGSKSSELELYQNHVKKIDKIHNYKINCLDFSFIPSSEFILMASGSNDRKIIITSISFKEQQKILIINTVYKYVHKVQIINLSWAINSRKLVCVGFNHHTVQLWDFSNYGSDKKEEEKHEEEYELCNIRGHSGYVIAANFYAENSNFVITASDDQTIKIWDIQKIANKKPPNKKKFKKKKKELVNI